MASHNFSGGSTHKVHIEHSHSYVLVVVVVLHQVWKSFGLPLGVEVWLRDSTLYTIKSALIKTNGNM